MTSDINEHSHITDVISNRGLEYAADYSDQYIERSLVDKIYIDEQFSNNTILPIIRRVAAQTIGLDLVPVQPMDGPTQIIHFNVDYWRDIDDTKVYTPDEFFNDESFDDYLK